MQHPSLSALSAAQKARGLLNVLTDGIRATDLDEEDLLACLELLADLCDQVQDAAVKMAPPDDEQLTVSENIGDRSIPFGTAGTSEIATQKAHF